MFFESCLSSSNSDSSLKSCDSSTHLCIIGIFLFPKHKQLKRARTRWVKGRKVMKSIKKLWVDAESYYCSIWQWPLPAELLTRHYYLKKISSFCILVCVCGELNLVCFWLVGELLHLSCRADTLDVTSGLMLSHQSCKQSTAPTILWGWSLETTLLAGDRLSPPGSACCHATCLVLKCKQSVTSHGVPYCLDPFVYLFVCYSKVITNYSIPTIRYWTL